MKTRTTTSRSLLNLAGCLAALALASNAFAALPKTVELAAGSVNGLADAVADAGAGGTVLVKAGVHDESGTTMVTIPVSIIGEQGAEIRCGTLPAPTLVFLGGPPSPLSPTIRVHGARDVRVENIHFTAAYGGANCAVLVQNSARVAVTGNHIDQFQTGVLVQHGDKVSIENNLIEIVPLWADPENPLALPEYFAVTQGINVVNGQFARIIGNTVTGAGFGIFGNDAHGKMHNNTAAGCMVGFILCHQLPLYSLDGAAFEAENAANLWQAQNNQALGNYMVGYLVIDGAHHNTLANNAASGNTLDIDLVGNIDYFGLGFTMPASHDNVVAQGSQKGLTIRDCGDDNIISGDVTIIPCQD